MRQNVPNPVAGAEVAYYPGADLGRYPLVSVVIPTYNRPQMMREALAAVAEQDYEGCIETVIVFDKADPDYSLERLDGQRMVRTIRNERTPGLAGARNSGVLAARGSVVAFCDDDDKWLPNKLTAQIDALGSDPEAEFVTTAMLVNFEGNTTPRLAKQGRVSFNDLLRSRMAMLHSSSFLVRRDALIHGIGLVDETLPRSMAEDWELLLRAAKRRPILNVDEPLVDVRWGTTSYFADQWALRNEAQLWLMKRYPEMLSDRMAAAFSYGKLAFGEAAQGHRKQAVSWAVKAVRANWREIRTYLAIGVVLRVVPPNYLVRKLNERGHGI